MQIETSQYNYFLACRFQLKDTLCAEIFTTPRRDIFSSSLMLVNSTSIYHSCELWTNNTKITEYLSTTSCFTTIVYLQLSKLCWKLLIKPKWHWCRRILQENHIIKRREWMHRILLCLFQLFLLTSFVLLWLISAFYISNSLS